MSTTNANTHAATPLVVVVPPDTVTTISFEGLVPGSEGVRSITIGGVPRASIRDLIMVVCDKDNNDAGRIWRNLPETNKNEVQQFVLNLQNEVNLQTKKNEVQNGNFKFCWAGLTVGM